jgi:hypothetical protein
VLLAACGQSPLQRRQLVGHVNQLKAFVDICHLYGLAVIFDVVYNHDPTTPRQRPHKRTRQTTLRAATGPADQPDRPISGPS